jgi:subtilisin-like proprotein convertase family protein
VQWDVAGTDSNGVNVSSVNILLSTDGGLSYPIILASNISNNGLYNIIVPEVQAPRCFIMVEANGNGFFAINSKAFSIGSYESSCSTYESKDIPKDVIFGTSNNAISLSEVNDDYEIQSLTVSVRIKHAFIKDLALSLESPKGTVIELLKNPCDYNDEDIDAVFSDDGEQIYCASFSPTISGNNLALGELSELNGENVKGKWKLKVADEAPGDDGVLEAWSMTICTAKLVLDVAENSLENFQVYPNPSEGQFTVIFSSDELGDVGISVYDLLGRKLHEKSYKEPSIQFEEIFNAEALTSGIYILKVRKGQRVSFRKLKIK